MENVYRYCKWKMEGGSRPSQLKAGHLPHPAPEARKKDGKKDACFASQLGVWPGPASGADLRGRLLRNTIRSCAAAVASACPSRALPSMPPRASRCNFESPINVIVLTTVNH